MKVNLKKIQDVIEIPEIANVHFFEFEKDYSTEEDSHAFCELVFSYSGTLEIRAENYKGKLRKGELLIHRAEERHALKSHKNKKTTVVIIGFKCPSPHLNAFANKPVKLSDGEIKDLARIVREGRNVFAPPYDVPVYDMKKKEHQIWGSEQLLRSLLENFLVELVRNYVIRDFKDDGKSSENFKFEEIIKYVDAHYTEKLVLEELAFLFNTNRSAFCKNFKSFTGKTFINYIAEKKLASISDLLLETKLSLSEIAVSVGFESVAYLCRFFKKCTGETPTEYRRKNEKTQKQHRNDNSCLQKTKGTD